MKYSIAIILCAAALMVSACDPNSGISTNNGSANIPEKSALGGGNSPPWEK